MSADASIRALAGGVMNRFRRLRGPNSYATELGADVLARIPPGGRWLDLGCGVGVAVREAARERPDVTIVAVDLHAGFVDGSALPPNLRFVQADATALPFGGSFDLVTAVHVLHFLADKARAVGDWAERLVAGGSLLANFDPADIRIGTDWETAVPLPGEPRLLDHTALGLAEAAGWGAFAGARPGPAANRCGVRSVQSLYAPRKA